MQTLRPSVCQSQTACEVNAANHDVEITGLQHGLLRPTLLGSFPEMTSEAAAVSCLPCGPVAAVWGTHTGLLGQGVHR